MILDSLREAFFMFWETLWALVLGFTLSGAVQAIAITDAGDLLVVDDSGITSVPAAAERP